MVKKKAAKKAAKTPKKIIKSKRYACRVCGAVVSVDQTCGCANTYDIICCGKSMSKKK